MPVKYCKYKLQKTIPIICFFSKFSVGPNGLYEYGNKVLDSTGSSLFTQTVIDPQGEHLFLKAYDMVGVKRILKISLIWDMYSYF